MKVVRHPQFSLTQPPPRYARSRPMFIPSENTPMAVPRFSGGKRSEMIEWEGGVDPASPTPTPILANAICTKVCAHPHSMAITLQMVIAAVMMFRRLVRSASIAMGMPRVAPAPTPN